MRIHNFTILAKEVQKTRAFKWIGTASLWKKETMVGMSVVRLGPNSDNVSATLLRTALVSHFQDEDQGSAESSVIDNKSGSTLTISNKYFTANVIFEDIGATRSEFSKEDGVILVFDALQSNPDRPSNSSTSSATFDSLALAHEETENQDGAGDLLRLCVGVTLTSPSRPEELRGQNAEKEYSRRILWCLDRGYEYVEADLSQEGQMRGHDDRDKEGFARIVEAIQGTVWSSAVMSQSTSKQLKETYQEDWNKNSQDNHSNDNDNEEEEKNPYEPPDPSMFGSFPTVENPSTATVMEEASGLVLDPESVGPHEMAELRKDLENDQVFEKMEGLLREASRIREASKNGEMTDQERRDRASDAAMALVNMMNHFGLDDEDDEDGSHVDSSDEDSSIVDGNKKV